LIKKAIIEDKHQFVGLICDHGFEFDSGWVESFFEEIHQKVIILNKIK
jgi:hypothetical protein